MASVVDSSAQRPLQPPLNPSKPSLAWPERIHIVACCRPPSISNGILFTHFVAVGRLNLVKSVAAVVSLNSLKPTAAAAAATSSG